MDGHHAATPRVVSTRLRRVMSVRGYAASWPLSGLVKEETDAPEVSGVSSAPEVRTYGHHAATPRVVSTRLRRVLSVRGYAASCQYAATPRLAP